LFGFQGRAFVDSGRIGCELQRHDTSLSLILL
jgi:hypothetical protein